MASMRLFWRRFAVWGVVLLPVSALAFLPVRGTYNGLFFEPEGVWQQSAGSVRLSTTASGTYSGQLQLGPFRYAFSGWFNGQGYQKQSIARSGYPTLLLEMQVDDQDPDVIYGTVSSSRWTADLILDRAVYDGKFSICPDAGQYTLLIPGSVGSREEPGGNSYATVTVDRAGRIRMAASMADGWKLTQSAMIAKGGEWPLFAPLYGGSGVLWSWMFFNPSAEEDLAGDITWIKPSLPQDWFYPGGFAIQVYSWGSRYTRPPKGTPILNLPEAAVELNGGGLYRDLLNKIAIDFSSKVANLGPDPMSLKFTVSNGLFKGKFRDPVTGNTYAFSGVALQRYNVASGFFRGYDETGEVWMEAW